MNSVAAPPMRASGLVLAATLVVLSGCASVPAGSTSGPGISATANASTPAATPGDPWENWNRKVYAFNDAVDTAVLKPVAQAYQNVVPSLVRTGIGNVLGNIRDVWSAANQLMQGKLQYGMEMGMRVLTNTFIGLGGVLDPATEMGLVRRSEDFGQTLGRWGVGNGPYMVLPLLGPSTLRDTSALVADLSVSPSSLPPTTNGRVAVTTLDVINTRARLLSAGNLLDQVALDRYSFLRDAYLAQRRDAIYDGATPMETFEDDGADPVAKPTAGAASGAAPGSAAKPASAPTLAKPAAAASAPASAASAATVTSPATK